MHVGLNVNGLKEFAKLNKTYREMAKDLGVSITSVSNWFNGDPISPKNRQKIMDYLDIKDFELLFEVI